MRSSRSSLLALAARLFAPAFPSKYRPTPPKRGTALQREIAEHNAEVDRRKAEKRAAKMRRKEQWR